MTKEQAIKICNKIIQQNNEIVKQTRLNKDINAMQLTANCDNESLAIETVLSMLKENSAEIEQKNTELAEKNAEIERLNRQIDLMAEYIFQNVDVEEDICNSAYIECTQETAQDITCINCIKQYFERKATNNG